MNGVVQLDLEEARRYHERVDLLVNRRDKDLKAFWQEGRSTFSLYGSQDQVDHVVSACTTVLSLIQPAGGRLPDFFEDSEDSFRQWLISTPWQSEGLQEHNVYITSLALAALLSLNPGQPEKDWPAIALCEERPVSALGFLVRELENARNTGLAFPPCPPSGFLTYWAVRALWLVAEFMRSGRAMEGRHRDALDQIEKELSHDPLEIIEGSALNRIEEEILESVRWAEGEVNRQIAYFTQEDSDNFDPLQMLYALCTADFHRDKKGAPPDRRMIGTALRCLFKAQLPNGLWAKNYSIYVDPERGSVYPFPFSALTAALRLGLRPSNPEPAKYCVELFEPHIDGLLKTLAWAEDNEVSSDAVKGWHFGHLRSETGIQPEEPQSWATGMVFSFARGLDFLLRHIMRTHLLREFNAMPPSGGRDRPTEENFMTRDLDCDPDCEDYNSIKKLLLERLVQAHWDDQDQHLGRDPTVKKIWSAVFFGPPGTGKTRLTKKIADSLGWPLVTLGTSDFLAQGADKMASQAQLIFRKLEQMFNCVILIDEVEQFVRSRDQSEAEDRIDTESWLMTTAMLTLIQGLREKESSILILATNYRDKFDDAVERPGRIDLLLFVPPPSRAAKIEYLKEELKGMGCKLEKKAEDRLYEEDKLERFTHAEWKKVVECCRDELKDKKVLDWNHVGRVVGEVDNLAITEDDWADWRPGTKKTRIQVT